MSKKEKNLEVCGEKKDKKKKEKHLKRCSPKRDIVFLNGSFYKYCKDQEKASLKMLEDINRGNWASYISFDPFEKYLKKLDYESTEMASMTDDQIIKDLIIRILHGEYPLSLSRVPFQTPIFKKYPFVNLLYDDPIAVKSLNQYGIKTKKDLETVRRFIKLYRIFSGEHETGLCDNIGKFDIPDLNGVCDREEKPYKEGLLSMLNDIKDSADYERNFDIRNCDCAKELFDKGMEVSYIDFGDILVTIANLMSTADKYHNDILSTCCNKSIREIIDRLILPISFNSCIIISTTQAFNNDEMSYLLKEKKSKYTNSGKEYIFSMPGCSIDQPTKCSFNDLIPYFSYVYINFEGKNITKRYFQLNELPIQAFDKWILYTGLDKKEEKKK